MSQFSPSLNLPHLKRKGMHAVFGGLRIPYYFTSVVLVEGQPVKLKATSAANCTDNYEVDACVMGASDGPKVIGLSLQQTYSESLTGQFAQLKSYHFPNDTAQRLDGSPIGILGGQGYALLETYSGLISAGEQLGVGPSGWLAGVTNSGLATGDKVNAWAESASGALISQDAGQNGDGQRARPVRIRFCFTFVAGNAA